jgi:hypothetical protein
MTRVEQVDPCASDAEQLGAYVTPTMQGSRNGMQIAAACASPPPVPNPQNSPNPNNSSIPALRREEATHGQQRLAGVPTCCAQ